ncbi:hypothetical protein ASPFODRAFT_51073 [Aspergillus luchuensis CBS 106.47]|uniref:Uncharacterized protein n=1 Tax=Aspergillus luchuensis (strain CBS 106.47) TaxID=1137211 RepID=A0A1M3T6B8_ASPLC|nr:hypothetical protein ASPFODRAFT_51073 [Aspergillus luchuensis CBS 106.47]
MTGRFQWCRQHHGFHDPWRYDVKKRPITEEAHMPSQPLSSVFRFRFSIFCLLGSSPWGYFPLAQEREKACQGKSEDNVISWERSETIVPRQSQ